MLQTLGHYKILDRIGTGGVGDVYRARDTRLGRTVAIKVVSAVLSGDADRRARFLSEARASASLSHPNIAALFEVGEDQNLLYLVFEFVPGETLKAIIGGRPLNPRRAVDFAVQIADALADAHAEGLVHLDLKPDNVIVTPKGNAKILDFGLAKWTAGGAARERAARAAATSTPIAGAIVARTVPYLSPEQARGQPVDHRSDIFSLGTILFEMLTGKLPFTAPVPLALTRQIIQGTAPAPTTISPGLPPELDAIVSKMMARRLEARYESAATVAAELRSVAAILDVRSGTSEPPVRVSRVPRRRSAAMWILTATILAAIAGLVWLATRVA